MKTILAISLLTLAACGAVSTPRYGIYVYTEEHGTMPDLRDVDTAWTYAAHLAGADPHELLRHDRPVISFTGTVIEYAGRKYSGLTVDEMSRVWARGCVLGSDTALVHEMLHVAIWLQTGDNDAGHTHAAWKHADGVFGQCRGVAHE